MKILTASVVLALSLAGCAKINDLSTRVLSSSASALAVVSDTLLSGKVVITTDRTGTVTLESDSGLKCMGSLRYTASRSGTIALQCSDGNEATMDFRALSETSGHASGRSLRGPASLTYGLDPLDAAAYLTLPPGKRLVPGGSSGSRLQ